MTKNNASLILNILYYPIMKKKNEIMITSFPIERIWTHYKLYFSYYNLRVVSKSLPTYQILSGSIF